jgi:hypothetical protein
MRDRNTSRIKGKEQTERNDPFSALAGVMMATLLSYFLA